MLVFIYLKLYTNFRGGKMWPEIADKLLKNPIFDNLNSIISPYINELKDFQFRIANPLFWVFFLIAAFFLNCFWKFKKAVIFCLIIAIILLITTALENSMGDTLFKSVLFDYMVFRYVSLFVILCVSLYFFFIKLD